MFDGMSSDCALITLIVIMAGAIFAIKSYGDYRAKVLSLAETKNNLIKAAIYGVVLTAVVYPFVHRIAPTRQAHHPFAPNHEIDLIYKGYVYDSHNNKESCSIKLTYDRNSKESQPYFITLDGKNYKVEEGVFYGFGYTTKIELENHQEWTVELIDDKISDW